MSATQKAAVGILLTWLPLACVASGLSLLIDLELQQNYRESLNDPQIQLAEDTARLIGSGPVSLEGVIQSEGVPQIDVAASLAPWVAIYDENGTPLISSAVINGAAIRIPVGVLAAARQNDGKDTDVSYENRVTWQPQPGVRQAIVVRWEPALKQFVVAGRNMREVEDRERRLGATVLAAWILIMAASLVLTSLSWYVHRRAL